MRIRERLEALRRRMPEPPREIIVIPAPTPEEAAAWYAAHAEGRGVDEDGPCLPPPGPVLRIIPTRL